MRSKAAAISLNTRNRACTREHRNPTSAAGETAPLVSVKLLTGDTGADFMQKQRDWCAQGQGPAESAVGSRGWRIKGNFEIALLEFCYSFQTLYTEQVLFLKQENNTIKSSGFSPRAQSHCCVAGCFSGWGGSRDGPCRADGCGSDGTTVLMTSGLGLRVRRQLL